MRSSATRTDAPDVAAGESVRLNVFADRQDGVGVIAGEPQCVRQVAAQRDICSCVNGDGQRGGLACPLHGRVDAGCCQMQPICVEASNNASGRSPAQTMERPSASRWMFLQSDSIRLAGTGPWNRARSKCRSPGQCHAAAETSVRSSPGSVSMIRKRPNGPIFGSRPPISTLAWPVPSNSIDFRISPVAMAGWRITSSAFSSSPISPGTLTARSSRNQTAGTGRVLGHYGAERDAPVGPWPEERGLRVGEINLEVRLERCPGHVAAAEELIGLQSRT